MKLWGWDTETFLWVDGLAAPRVVCGSYADETSEGLLTPSDNVRFLGDAADRGEHLAGVNIAFDVVGAAATDAKVLPLIFKAGDNGLLHCVAIREALNDIALGRLFIDHKTGKEFANAEGFGERYSLKILMDRHFNVDISAEKEGDVWRYKYASLDGVPFDQWPEEARAYPIRDARRPRDICLRQRALGFRNRHDEPAQVRAAIALQLAKVWGFRTDAEYVSHVDQDVDRLWNETRAEFTKAGIIVNGVKKKAGLAELVTAAYKGNPPLAPKGGVSADRDTLIESGDPLLMKLGTSGKNDKRKTLYVPLLKRGVNVPVNPEFNVLVATGRISSDWQQLPQKGGIREGIVARGYLKYLQTRTFLEAAEDTVLVSLDFGGLELRTMSQRAIYEVGFSRMAEFINQGKDVHTHVAAYFLGCTYEELLARVKAKDPVAKNFRALAKVFNFGKGGGMGAAALAYNARQGTKGETTTGPDGTVYTGSRFCILANRAPRCAEHLESVRVQGKQKRVCSVCVQVAKELGDKWLEAWPEQGLLFEKAGRLTEGGNLAESTVFGSNRVRGGCRYTQWLNTPFQGAGGDGCKDAMWEIARETYEDRRSPLFGVARTVLNVHDELILEIKLKQLHEAAFRAAGIMVARMNRVTPDAHNEVVPAAGRRLFKDMRDVYDKAGRLRPWWPLDDKVPWAWGPDLEMMARDIAA